MYKQIYTIPFKSIEENSYNIIIEKKGFTGSSEELTGASSPFVVEVDLESPLKPFRLSTATLSVYGGDYLQSLFTPNPQGVRVKLLKNGSVEWLGFITNDTYSQDYSNIEFVYEIELVNPLSTLKYKKFESDAHNITFKKLIFDAIEATNSEITKIYLPKFITDENNSNIYDLIYTSTGNYVDEQDKEMNYYEILEEIAKYLGLTITIDKDAVYFIDYIAIGKGYKDYYEYNLETNVTINKTLSHNETVQSLGYVSDSSSLQINSGKNKAKVTCSLFEIDNLLPEFNNKGAKLKEINPEYKLDYEDETGIIRYFDQPKYSFYNQELVNRKLIESEGDIFTLLNEETALGSCFVRTTQYNNKDTPSKLRFENEVLIKNYIVDLDSAPIYDKVFELTNNNRIISFKSEKSVTFSPEVYFCFNAEIKFNQDRIQLRDTVHKFQNDTTIDIPVGFRIGSHYYDGTNWTTTPSKFNVPVTVTAGGVFMRYFGVKNTNDFTYGVGDLSGFIFKAPDFIIEGDCELTIYYFTTRQTNIIANQYNYIKDIELTYQIANTDSIYDEVEIKNDIIYENDIDEIYVDEAEEIDLKICTFPDAYHKLCYSTTFINNTFLTTLKYNPLNLTDKPENILIHKVIEYHKEPKYEVSIPVNNKLLYPYSIITDSNLPNKRFIYAGSEINYEYEKNTINILEI